ncbi:hypothetical protein [Pseudooceanicola sp. MF1-13]|uniref:Rz1-like lysis system protein LysC n=1 Tax=Pseudooceanicola sp. MF1-13 TaxID=3379095 RepID=UPI0038924A7B
MLIALTACADPEQVYLRPDIPAETLTPCPISDRKVVTVNDLAALAMEHRFSAECANGKIVTIAAILSGKPQ